MTLPSPAQHAHKTLFLQAPSFDGFDGGAGSRYQAKREIKSFWFPTWLAQPAALVPDSRLLDAPADELTVDQTREIARGYDLVIMHTSTPSFPTDAKFAELLQAGQPPHQDRPGGRQDHGRSRGFTEGHPRGGLRVPRGIRLYLQGSRRWPAAEGHQRTVVPRRGRPHRAQFAARHSREHGRAALRRAGLPARSEDRELLHRLSEASLRQLLYRSRLPLQVHLLPVAADRGRAPLPGALGAERYRRGDDGSRRTCPK